MAGNRVQINYDEMNNAATQYQKMSDETAALAQKSMSTYTSITGYWEGVADDEMKAQMDTCNKRLNTVQQMFVEVSKAITQTVKTFQEADAQAKTTINSTIQSDTAA
jgi:WXG100 family type VII secretion target